jgi:hypothetical protein
LTQSWKTVRIFISSTFRDTHAERDHFIKVVFPELRERYAKHQLRLIDVDLRGGTEEEAEQGKVPEVVLEEIERSCPFFIGVLGELNGPIPDYISEGAKFAHRWLENFLTIPFLSGNRSWGIEKSKFGEMQLFLFPQFTIYFRDFRGKFA